jgi:hypothetical protein
VLIVFDLGYLARFVCAASIYRKAYAGEYLNPTIGRIATEAPAIFLDGIPILLVLVMHHMTFKQAASQSELHDLVMSDDDENEEVL